jgi:hypothetical protein
MAAFLHWLRSHSLQKLAPSCTGTGIISGLPHHAQNPDGGAPPMPVVDFAYVGQEEGDAKEETG